METKVNRPTVAGFVARLGENAAREYGMTPFLQKRWSRAEKSATETPLKKWRAERRRVTEYPAALPLPSCRDVDAGEVRFGPLVSAISTGEREKSVSIAGS